MSSAKTSFVHKYSQMCFYAYPCPSGLPPQQTKLLSEKTQEYLCLFLFYGGEEYEEANYGR